MAAAAAEQDVDALDDMSNQQLVDAMLRAKNERRRAESDVQLLANRLAHLKAEEEKARRKAACGCFACGPVSHARKARRHAHQDPATSVAAAWSPS